MTDLMNIRVFKVYQNKPRIQIAAKGNNAIFTKTQTFNCGKGCQFSVLSFCKSRLYFIIT